VIFYVLKADGSPCIELITPWSAHTHCNYHQRTTLLPSCYTIWLITTRKEKKSQL